MMKLGEGLTYGALAATVALTLNYSFPDKPNVAVPAVDRPDPRPDAARVEAAPEPVVPIVEPLRRAETA